MSKAFTLSNMTCAITTVSITSIAGAAGLDRTSQPSAQFSENGTQAYISAFHVTPKISGVEEDGKIIDSVSKDYTVYSYGAKTDVNDTVSVGVYYEQPFGSDVYFEGENTFVDYSDKNNIKSSEAIVRSDNFTGLVNVKLGDNFQVYGGPVLQKLEGSLQVHGNPPKTPKEAKESKLGVLNSYELDIIKNTEYGYMVGAAYSKPEIGLKAAITYRSAIDHDMTYAESMPLVKTPALQPLNLKDSQTAKAGLELPQSVNIDFQTGLNRTTLLTARARWVPWSKFAIVPPLLNENGKFLSKVVKNKVIDQAPVLAYSDDSYQIELGVAKRLSPQLAVSGNIGWDSGAGNPVSPLGPIEGYYSVGVGAKYNITPNWAISGGAKYLMLGDAEGQLSASKTNVGKFEGNNAYVVGLKLSYQAK
ncbi:OmpP1/FadL family transporter [Psychrobacter sp. I-STPA10]|uniref:OmpP1/FadL family transporter n=1 Tax=Psychrobacter sp. I-STPA10 TaxID=2585769 RepID=UPI001E6545AB|nr:outer membrane protein transport protein [Psychrobacter sp. I-STPA10]